MRSIEADPNDGQTWYLLGRCYMAQQKYRKAYDAYQQAVYRDSQNPTFWCSIGVLYYQINQYRDALDAYSRAIRLNPYLSEVWYDLGTLYESCSQISDSLDAYQRAAELDPNNKHIQQRLQLLKGTPTALLTDKSSGAFKGHAVVDSMNNEKDERKFTQGIQEVGVVNQTSQGESPIPSLSELVKGNDEKKQRDMKLSKVIDMSDSTIPNITSRIMTNEQPEREDSRLERLGSAAEKKLREDHNYEEKEDKRNDGHEAMQVEDDEKTTNYRRTRKTLPKRSPDARIPKNVPVETHSGSDSDRANANTDTDDDDYSTKIAPGSDKRRSRKN